MSGKVVLANSFSLNMLPLPVAGSRRIHLLITPLEPAEFCDYLRISMSRGVLTNALEHEAVASLVSALCDVEVRANQVNITLSQDDVLLIIQVAERLPEGKVLTKDELMKMLMENKIKFYGMILIYKDWGI